MELGFPGVLLHALPGGGLRWWYPEVLAVICAFFTLYCYLVGPYRERRGLAAGVERRRLYSFMAGLAVMAVSEATPIHFISEEYLFSGQILQRVLLTMAMAPLLLACPPPWLVQRAVRRP